MARVRFTEKFNYDVPGTASTIAYCAGWEGTVKRDCANQAIAAGKAVPLPLRGRLPDGKNTGRG